MCVRYTVVSVCPGIGFAIGCLYNFFGITSVQELGAILLTAEKVWVSNVSGNRTKKEMGDLNTFCTNVVDLLPVSFEKLKTDQLNELTDDVGLRFADVWFLVHF